MEDVKNSIGADSTVMLFAITSVCWCAWCTLHLRPKSSSFTTIHHWQDWHSSSMFVFCPRISKMIGYNCLVRRRKRLIRNTPKLECRTWIHLDNDLSKTVKETKIKFERMSHLSRPLSGWFMEQIRRTTKALPQIMSPPFMEDIWRSSWRPLFATSSVTNDVENDEIESA